MHAASAGPRLWAPILAVLLTAVVGLPASAASAIYRWVDADGVVHYSQTAPEGVDYERVDASGKPRSRRQGSIFNPVFAEPTTEQAAAPAAQEDDGDAQPRAGDEGLTEEQLAQRAQLQAQADARLAEIEATKKRNCQLARQQFEQFTTYARIRISDGQGGERAITEDERQERIREAELAIIQNCEGEG